MQLAPVSGQDLRNFLEKYPEEIRSGEFAVSLDRLPIEDLTTAEMEFLAGLNEASARVLASSTSVPAEILEKIAEIYGKEMDSALTGNENTPLDVVLEIAARCNEYSGSYGRKLIKQLIERGDKEVLSLLARSLSWASALEDVAQSEALPGQDIELLSRNPSSSVREAIVRNPKCPLEVMKLLAKDEDSRVRQAVARSHRGNSGILELLAKDEDSWVRRAVARNPRCPSEILENLASDQDSNVREVAAAKVGKSETPSASELIVASLLAGLLVLLVLLLVVKCSSL